MPAKNAMPGSHSAHRVHLPLYENVPTQERHAPICRHQAPDYVQVPWRKSLSQVLAVSRHRPFRQLDG